ncbi:MAG: hypothetical protein ACFFD2_14200 [Promethearchaeota archaeon]
MSENKKNYVTVQEIDGMIGIRSPHARELEDIGKLKVDLFLKNKKRQIKIIVENQLNGKINNIGFSEDYTVTFKFFPKVKAHVLFYNYENEDDNIFEGSEVKFLFSGERVMWVPTEDSISLIVIALDYLENILTDNPEVYGLKGEKSDLLKMSLEQRKEPFVNIQKKHLDDLASFVGGEVKQEDNIWKLSKIYFEGIKVIITYDMKNERLGIEYEGENLIKINNYSRDQLGIFLINHCLRFISITYLDIKMPKIVKQMFSFSYLKSHQ